MRYKNWACEVPDLDLRAFRPVAGRMRLYGDGGGGDGGGGEVSTVGLDALGGDPSVGVGLTGGLDGVPGEISPGGGLTGIVTSTGNIVDQGGNVIASPDSDSSPAQIPFSPLNNPFAIVPQFSFNINNINGPALSAMLSGGINLSQIPGTPEHAAAQEAAVQAAMQAEASAVAAAQALSNVVEDASGGGWQTGDGTPLSSAGLNISLGLDPNTPGFGALAPTIAPPPGQMTVEQAAAALGMTPQQLQEVQAQSALVAGAPTMTSTSGLDLTTLNQLSEMGLGNSPVSNTQTVNQAIASINAHNFLNENIGNIMGAMVPGAGMMISAAQGLGGALSGVISPQQALAHAVGLTPISEAQMAAIIASSPEGVQTSDGGIDTATADADSIAIDDMIRQGVLPPAAARQSRSGKNAVVNFLLRTFALPVVAPVVGDLIPSGIGPLEQIAERAITTGVLSGLGGGDFGDAALRSAVTSTANIVGGALGLPPSVAQAGLDLVTTGQVSPVDAIRAGLEVSQVLERQQQEQQQQQIQDAYRDPSRAQDVIQPGPDVDAGSGPDVEAGLGDAGGGELMLAPLFSGSAADKRAQVAEFLRTQVNLGAPGFGVDSEGNFRVDAPSRQQSLIISPSGELIRNPALLFSLRPTEPGVDEFIDSLIGGDIYPEATIRPREEGGSTAGLIAVGDSANPPAEGGKPVFGSGSGSAPGDVFPISLIARDNGLGAGETDGFSVFMYSDGTTRVVPDDDRRVVMLDQLDLNQDPSITLEQAGRALMAANPPVNMPSGVDTSGDYGQSVFNEIDRTLAAQEQQRAEETRRAIAQQQETTAPVQQEAQQPQQGAQTGVQAPIVQEQGVTPEQVQQIVTEAIQANPSLTEQQVRDIVSGAVQSLPAGLTQQDVSEVVSDAISRLPAAPTAGDIDSAISRAMTDVATKADVSEAIRNIQFPEGINQEDVTRAISDYMAENPGLTAADVAQQVQQQLQQLPTYATPQDVRATVRGAMADVATKEDVQRAISGIQFPAGLSEADVTRAITDYMRQNPGLSAQDVADQVGQQLSQLPVYATPDDVNAAIRGAMTDVATRSDVQKAIAGIQFPAGLTEADVSRAITDYMRQNPGLSPQDVAQQVGEQLRQLPAYATPADVESAIQGAMTNVVTRSDVEKAIQGIRFPAGISRADVTDVIADYMRQNPGLSAAEVTSLVGEQLSRLPAYATPQDVESTVRGALAGYATSEDVAGLGRGLEAVRGDLTQLIADAQASGLRGDAALNASLEALANELGTTRQGLLSSLGTTESALRSEFASQIGGVQTQMTELGESLRSAISDARLAGLRGDEALQIGLESLADRLGTTREDLLATMGTNERSLRSEFASQLGEVSAQIGDVEGRLQDKIAAAQSSGIQGDAALRAGLDALASDLGTTRADLLSQLGTTEQLLRSDFAAQLGGVQSQVSQLGTNLNAAIADARAAGLQGDAALQAGLNTLAGNLGTTKTDLLAQLGQTEESLRSQFQTALGELETGLTGQIGQLQQGVAQQFAAMTAAQQAEVANRVQQGQDLSRAIADVQSGLAGALGEVQTGLTGQIGGLRQEMQSQYDAMTAAQQAEVARRVQQGQDLARAIGDVQSGLAGTIAGVEAGLTGQIGALSQQTQAALAQQSSQTQQQFNTLSAAQQAQADALVQQGQSLTSAINQVQSGLAGQISALSAQTQEQLASQSAQTQAQFNQLSDAQKAQADALVRQGVSLTAALNEVQSGLAGQIGGLRQEVQSQYDALSAAQQAEVGRRVQQGQDLSRAIADVQSGLTSTIAGVEAGLTGQIGGLRQEVAQQYQALSDAQKAEVSNRIQQGQSLEAAIAGVQSGLAQQVSGVDARLNARVDQLMQQGVDYQTATNQALREVTGELGTLGQQQREQAEQTQTAISGVESRLGDRISQLMQQGLSYQAANDLALAEVRGGLGALGEQQAAQGRETQTAITGVETRLGDRIDELVRRGATYQEATDLAFQELTGSVSTLAQRQAEEAAARQAAEEERRRQFDLQLKQQQEQQMLSLGSSLQSKPASVVDPYKATFLTPFIVGGEAPKEFVSPLAGFLKEAAGKPFMPERPKNEEPEKTQPLDFFATDENPLQMYEPAQEYTGLFGFRQGGMVPMAQGGTRHGENAHGALRVLEHSGKRRVDYRQGDAVTGIGDGQSDDIPAMLADGEFVIPADVVAALGNGSTKAGSDKLYDMMHNIRRHHRSTGPKDLPPPAKSPLEYIRRTR